MSASNAQMVNEDYDPSAGEQRILSKLREGRDAGEPWGRATPRWLAEELDEDVGDIQYWLGQLHTAGWLKRLRRGFYEYNEDPRE